MNKIQAILQEVITNLKEAGLTKWTLYVSKKVLIALSETTVAVIVWESASYMGMRIEVKDIEDGNRTMFYLGDDIFWIKKIRTEIMY